MRNSTLLWEAWKLSKAYGVLPSDLYGIDGYQAAFAFDRAVYDFGSHVEAELENVEGKNKKEIESKRIRVIRKYFPKAEGASESRRFADPAKRST